MLLFPSDSRGCGEQPGEAGAAEGSPTGAQPTDGKVWKPRTRKVHSAYYFLSAKTDTRKAEGGVGEERGKRFWEFCPPSGHRNRLA